MDVYSAPPPDLSGDHYGGHPLGMFAEQLAADGESGPGYLAATVTLPADAGRRIRGPITQWPSGALQVFEDGSFSYLGATSYALFRLYVDGVLSGTDIGHGVGVGRIEFTVGAASVLGGAVQLADVVAGGGLVGGNPSDLGGSVEVAPVVVGGSMGGPVAISAPPARRRVQTTTRAPRGGARRGR